MAGSSIAPVIDSSGAPTDAATLFGVPSGAATGPCLVDPELGALFPGNWLRLRIHFLPVGAQNLFEMARHNRF